MAQVRPHRTEALLMAFAARPHRGKRHPWRLRPANGTSPAECTDTGHPRALLQGEVSEADWSRGDAQPDGRGRGTFDDGTATVAPVRSCLRRIRCRMLPRRSLLLGHLQRGHLFVIPRPRVSMSRRRVRAAKGDSP
jgi:hypothetical protein